MYVMKFDDLLKAAQEAGLTRGGGDPLVLRSADQELLSRLYQVRHSVEHPKPGIASYTRGYLLEAIRPAARVTAWLSRHNDVHDLLSEDEHEAVRAAAETVERLCDQGLHSQ